jgi:hypothetical protein
MPVVRLANKIRVRTAPPGPQEWEIQAEAVRRCRQLPGYGDEWSPGVTFTLAGDFNAGRRGMREQVKAKATGLTKGEPDIRFYGLGGRLLLIELKGPKTPVSKEQTARHALLRGLGHRVEIVRGKTIEQGAADVVELVRGWLAESHDDYARGRAHGFTSGYYAAANDTLNLINTFEDKQVAKKDVYHAVADLRPPANDNLPPMDESA